MTAPAPTSTRVQASFFRLEVDGVDLGTFTSVSGLSSEVEVVTDKALSDTGMSENKQPSRLKFEELSLKRGLTGNRSINDWIDETVDAGNETAYKNGAVVALSRDLQTEIARFNFFDAYPTKLSISDLDSSGGGDAMVEELTIRHHRIEWA